MENGKYKNNEQVVAAVQHRIRWDLFTHAKQRERVCVLRVCNLCVT